MKFASFLIWMGLASLGLLLGGCGVNSSPDYNLLGRYVVTEEGGYQMGWPASGAELSFEGKRLTVTLTDGGQGIMDVFVNGEETTLPLNTGTHDYVLINSETAQRFDVVLSRRTEVFDTGLFTIEGIDTDGQFLAVPSHPRKILFLGDSITAGFGVRGDTKECQYNPATNAPRKAYAALTADGFKADSHLIAISGRGVVHNWDANPAPVMPAQIDYALPDQESVWNHQNFIPDVIVTTLGTNDWSVIDPGQNKFRHGYRDMLSDLRKRFPKAHVVAVNGPLLNGDKLASVRDGIDWAITKMADSNISTVDVTLAPNGLIWSCNYHPGRDSMKLMANQLGAHIARKVGWSFNPVKLDNVTVTSVDGSQETLLKINPPETMLEGGKEHFNWRMQTITKLPKQSGGIMMVGDSLTEAWGQYESLFPQTITNHGIGWDTAEGVSLRLPEILRHEPDKIFILIGTNDIGYNHSAASVSAYVKTVIASLQAQNPKAKLYLQSVLPREAEAMSSVRAYNQAYKDLAESMNVDYIDMVEAFAAPDGTLRSNLTYDGLHFNEEGYRVWAAQLAPYFE